MKGLAAVLSALVALALFASPSPAFNGHRRGFILGFGIGPGYSYRWSEATSSGGMTDKRASGAVWLATDFRIGFGVTSRLLLYYDNKVSWAGNSNGLDFEGLNSLAASYYFQDAHPSLYLAAGLGSAGVGRLYSDGSANSRRGFGSFGGVGYEMSKRFALEGTLGYGRLTHSYSIFEITDDYLSFRAQLIVQWY